METASLLLARGGKPSVRKEGGSTALMAAAWTGHLPVAKLILDHAARMEAEAGGALQQQQDEVRRLLDEQNKDGCSGLWFAAGHGRAEMVGFLLSRGADFLQADCDGYTALHVARLRGYEDCALLLEETERAYWLYQARRLFDDATTLRTLPRAGTRARFQRRRQQLTPKYLRVRADRGLEFPSPRVVGTEVEALEAAIAAAAAAGFLSPSSPSSSSSSSSLATAAAGGVGGEGGSGGGGGPADGRRSSMRKRAVQEEQEEECGFASFNSSTASCWEGEAEGDDDMPGGEGMGGGGSGGCKHKRDRKRKRSRSGSGSFSFTGASASSSSSSSDTSSSLEAAGAATPTATKSTPTSLAEAAAQAAAAEERQEVLQFVVQELKGELFVELLGFITAAAPQGP